MLHDAAGTGPAHPDLMLVPFSFWHPRHPGRAAALAGSHGALDPAPVAEPPDPADLRAAIAAHLSDCGWPGCEALRWAITAVDPNRGLQLEGVAIANGKPASPGP